MTHRKLSNFFRIFSTKNVKYYILTFDEKKTKKDGGKDANLRTPPKIKLLNKFLGP